MHWQEGGGRGCVYTHGNCRRNLTARSPARRYSMYKHSPVITAVSLLHLLPLLLMWMPPVCADDSAVTVNVLSMMYNPEYYVEKVNAINAGFDASLSAHGWKTGSGATISVIRPPSYNTTAEDIFQLGVKQSEGKLLVVFGPLGTDPVVWVRDKLKENDLVAIAPIAYSSEVRGWNPHLYSISVEPNAELLALIRYAVVYLGLPRVGLMYAKGNGFDKESYEFTMRIMEMMGRKPCGVFAVESSGGRDVLEGELNTKWGQFVATRPQAVLLFSSIADDTTGWFVKKIAQDNRTVDMYLLAPSSFQHFLIKTWSDALVSLNRTFTPGQLITTGTVPLASDNRSSMVRHFQRDMDNYLDTNSDWKGFAKPEHYLKDDKLGEMMVFGWLAGEVLFEALNNAPQLTNRTSFMESLYKQRRYVIDDFVVGDFGGECDEGAALQGAMCNCNEGGSMAHMRVVDDSLSLKPMKKGSVTWSVSECSSANVQVSAPLIGLYVVLTDDKVAQRASMRWSLGARSLEEADDVDKRIFFHSLKVNLKNLTQSLEQVRDTKAVAAVLGVVTADILSVPNMTFIGPIPLFPRLNKFWRNVIHLQPLLAQQLYVLAVYLSNTSSMGVKALVRGGEASEVVDTLDKSLVTFGVSLDSSKTLGDGDPISSYLSGDGDVFCIGLTPPDVAAVARHLQTHRRARVFVPFNDILLFYQEFVAAFNASKESIASSQRLLFATSFPHWAEKNTKSDMVARFHRHVNESHWDPLTFLGFATTRLLQVVISNMRKVNAELLADRIYTESNIRVDDVRFGPFSDAECVSGTSVSANECASNFGATNISVWSMARVLNSSLTRTQVGMTPSMDYVIPQEGQLTQSQIAGIISGCVSALLLFIALGVFLHISLRNARNNNRAPKEPTDPVTLIFTDIESSTALWAAHPDLMPDAVAAHHRMVRSLIGRYKCYEVKTVGDSFMIASKSPFAAVQLAQELQLCFLHHDWGTNALDDSYREFEEQRAEGECEYTPPTAHMDPEVYSRLWNGLRVRVGIHTGLCDIRHDEVTKGYDYYGRTPNMAARTESVANGGQVLMTHAAYMSLSAEDRKQIDVTALGAVALRGVSDPVKMYQLNTVPSRNFAALRLDREYFFDEGEDGTTTSTSDHSSSRAELSESAQIIATALQSLLSTFKTAHREKLLLPYCERWRVPLPRKAASEWDDAYCEEVVRRIAVKVGRVADHGAHSGSESSSTQGSSSIIIVPFYDMHLQEY